jgi:hypothetical protein
MIDYIDISKYRKVTDYKELSAIVERMTVLAKSRNISIILSSHFNYDKYKKGTKGKNQ